MNPEEYLDRWVAWIDGTNEDGVHWEFGKVAIVMKDGRLGVVLGFPNMLGGYRWQKIQQHGKFDATVSPASVLLIENP